MSLAHVIDLNEQRLRRRSRASFDRLRADTAARRPASAPLTWHDDPIPPPRLFQPYDQVEDKCTGRRGLVIEVTGTDRCRVMFFVGRNCQTWHAECWGYQLRLLRTADQLRLRIASMVTDEPPSPA